MTAPENNAVDSVDFIFMMEPGYLQWQAVLLVSSLLEHAVNRGEIVAYCRQSRVGDLNPLATNFLASHGIELRPIDNPFSPEYPQGNKTVACAAHKSPRGVVFLDTDVLMLRDADCSTIIEPGKVSVCLAKRQWPESGSSRASWTNNYALCGQEFDYDAELIDGKPAYFNAGVVGFYGPENFGEAWLEVAEILDRAEIVDRRPWLDQVALPVATKKAKLSRKLLPRVWNCGLNNNLPVPPNANIGHYHRTRRIRQHKLVQPANRLLQKYSLFPNLKALIKALHPEDNYIKT